MRLYLTKTLLFLLLLVDVAASNDLLVKPADKNIIEVLPRNTATTFFKIDNQSAEEKEIITTPQLPNGWKQITSELSFIIPGNSSDSRLFSFFVPPATPVGIYEIKYAVQDRRLLSSRDETTIQVKVLPTHEIVLHVINYPSYAIEDKLYQIKYQVLNNCNFAERISFNAHTSETSDVHFSPKSIELLPGESDTVVVTATSQLKEPSSMKNHIQLIASSGSSREKIVDDIFIEIIPKSLEKKQPYHRLPVKMSLRRVFQQNNVYQTGYQGEMYGNGYLNEAKTQHLIFRLRGPDIYSRSFLADHDEYFVDYSNKTLKVYAGDGYYRLSQLTEKVRYGRGMSAMVNLYKLQLGCYYQQTRWLRPSEKQTGGFIKYNLPNESFVGVNVLQKDRLTDASVVSIESTIIPNRFNNINLEVAQGNSNNTNTLSYMSKLNGQVKSFTYMFELVHADPNFPGYYRDTRYFTAALSYRFSNNLRIDTNIRQEKQNFDIDSTQYSAPLSHFSQIGLWYRPYKHTSFNVDYMQRSRKDRLDIPKFDYEEQTGRLGFSQMVGRWSMYCAAEYGKTYNNLTLGNYDMRRFTLSTRYLFKQKNSVQAYLYLDDNKRYTGEKQKRMTTGVNAKIHFAAKTYMDLSFQNNYEPEDYYQDRNIFHIRFVHTLPFKHEISITGRHTLLRNSLNEKESAFLIDYSIPYDIPTSRNKQSNLIYGKVIDAETMNPVADLYLRLNNKPVLTDKDGNFSFSNVRPGEHFLYLDESQLGYGNITTPKLPLKINVTGGQKEYIEVFITKAAAINGRVINANDKDGRTQTGVNNNYSISGALADGSTNSNYGNQTSSGYLTDGRGIQSIYLEIIGPNGKERRFTDRYGNFYFEALMPGNYTVVVNESNLPQLKYFDKKTFEIVLAPGQNKDIHIEALNRKRPVLLTQSDEVLTVQPIEPDDLQNYIFASRLLKELAAEPAITVDFSSDIILGLAYYRIRKYRFAIDALQNAISTDTKSQDALLLIGLCYLKMGDTKKANSYFEQTVNKDQHSLAASIAQEHLGVVQSHQTKKPKAFLLHYTDGLNHIRNNEYKQACEAFSKSVYTTSDIVNQAESYRYIGQCLYQLGKYDEALKLLDKAVKHGTKMVGLEALYWSGLCNVRTQNKETSKELFSLVAEFSKDDSLVEKANDNLAQLYK